MFGRKKVPATATVLADEGYKWASNGPNTAKQYEKYILEVHPEGAAPFRVETSAWVGWLTRPTAGDTVNVLWKPGTQHVEIVVGGDIRYDDGLRASEQQQADAALREQLLQAPPGTPVPTQAGPAPATGTDVCPGCGQPRTAGVKFCPKCGTRIG
jgi:hypothetical protein